MLCNRNIKLTMVVDMNYLLLIWISFPKFLSPSHKAVAVLRSRHQIILKSGRVVDHSGHGWWWSHICPAFHNPKNLVWGRMACKITTTKRCLPCLLPRRYSCSCSTWPTRTAPGRYDKFNISPSAHCSILQVLTIMSAMVRAFVSWPTGCEKRVSATSFQRTCGLEGVIGTMVPEVRGGDYMNRKSYYSVLQWIVDAEFSSANVEARISEKTNIFFSKIFGNNYTLTWFILFMGVITMQGILCVTAMRCLCN